MCGIAGIIYRNGNGAHRLGARHDQHAQSMKHRGPDSTGFALYHRPTADLVLRIKLADGDATHDIEYADGCAGAGARSRRGCAPPARVETIEDINQYTIAATLDYDGELKHLADHVESVPGPRSVGGLALEIVKDLGDATTVGNAYKLDGYIGTHGIGHVRMATESDVDISNAHPYWAYPFADVAVVHNGQLTTTTNGAGASSGSATGSRPTATRRSSPCTSLEDTGGDNARAGDAPEPRRPRRRVHLHLRV